VKWRRLIAYALAALMAAPAVVPSPGSSAEAATRRSTRRVVKKKAPARQGTTARQRTTTRQSTRRSARARTVARRKARPRRPTAAERAAARRRAAEARREAARRRAAELERQRKALQAAWQADKQCYQSGRVFTEPRLKSDDPIEIPKELRGGNVKAALLMYEANVDKDGHLRSLRTLRPVPQERPWPQLHEAVVKSVREWKWDKTKVAGKTIPVCFPLTLNLDLR
jgi:hypothetical protein